MKTISELIASINSNIETSIANSIKSIEEDRKIRLTNLDLLYQAGALLAPLGIDFEISWYTARWGVDIDLKGVTDIAQVVQAVGPVKSYGSNLKDAAKRIVTKTFRSKLFPCVKFNIDMQLPNPRTKAGKKVKCKIVKRRVPAYVETTLVCEM